ncbi:unnamed protein product, partial [Polarella glacialis]
RKQDRSAASICKFRSLQLVTIGKMPLCSWGRPPWPRGGEALALSFAALALGASGGIVEPLASASEAETARRTDAKCWTENLFLERCCAVPEAESLELGCWNHEFTFLRCCGNQWQPQGYEAWLAAPFQEGADYVHCAEFVKLFKFEELENKLWDRYKECLKDRINSSRSAWRPATLAGQHFPTVLAPGPDGLMFAVPANDFVVSKHIKMFGTFDPQELRLYKELLPVGGTFVDVGANVGAYSVPLAVHVGREGRVLAVEPFQSLFQMLTANSAINGLRNMRTRQLGLGAVEERVQARGPNLEEMNNVGMARVFRPFEEKHAATFAYRMSGTETIDVSTLDKLVELEELKEITVLKVDTEGHLKAVLAGAYETLRLLRPTVVAEFSEDDALQVLERTHGYKCDERMPEHELWVCVPEQRQ